MPFKFLVARLMVVSRPETDFERYRGSELRTDTTATSYDAAIIPNDLGKNVECVVLESKVSDVSFSIYRCTITTMSYGYAVSIRDSMVEQVKTFKLQEDELAEHGEVVKERNNKECAPTGECPGDHAFFTTRNQDMRFLEIEAKPTFVYGDAAWFVANGLTPPISSVSPNSASVVFEVFSSHPGKPQ